MRRRLHREGSSMPGNNFEPDFDDQDQSETFDETMTFGEDVAGRGGDSPLGPGDEARTFEEMPDVLDVTQAIGDRDDDEALALDADEFSEDAVGDGDLEEDDELDYRASDEEHEDDLDGLGAEAGSEGVDEDAIEPDEIEGLDEVRDAGEASGGEDDFTNFQAKQLSDEDLKRMGYSEDRGGETRAKPNG